MIKYVKAILRLKMTALLLLETVSVCGYQNPSTSQISYFAACDFPCSQNGCTEEIIPGYSLCEFWSCHDLTTTSMPTPDPDPDPNSTSSNAVLIAGILISVLLFFFGTFCLVKRFSKSFQP